MRGAKPSRVLQAIRSTVLRLHRSPTELIQPFGRYGLAKHHIAFLMQLFAINHGHLMSLLMRFAERSCAIFQCRASRLAPRAQFPPFMV
jgi:hypothetical protein